MSKIKSAERYVIYNHNDRVIGIHDDLGNAAEEANFYEEVTGNRTTIRIEPKEIVCQIPSQYS